MDSRLLYTVLFLFLAPTPLFGAVLSQPPTYRPPEFGPPHNPGEGPGLFEREWFCSPSEAKGKSASYCEVKFEQANRTWNAYLNSHTTTPILPDYPYTLDKLPEPILPMGIIKGAANDGGVDLFRTESLEKLYTLAVNTTLEYQKKPQKYRNDDEREWRNAKFAMWAIYWCNLGSDLCEPFWKIYSMNVPRSISAAEEFFRKAMTQKGLIMLGDRILNFIGKPENDAVREQCMKAVHHKGEDCDKKGQHCLIGEWDDNDVHCEIDCGDQVCLKLAGGRYIG